MKINWTQAKKDYISDQQMSYAKIAEKYGVSETAVKEHASKDRWIEEREKTLQKIAEKLPEKISETIAEYQARKFLEGKSISDRAISVLLDPNTKITARTARDVVETGHKLQTEAMGLDNPKTVVNVQNNNFLSLSDFYNELKKRNENG